MRAGNTRAALETIELLTSAAGAELLRQFHFLPSPLLGGGDIDAMPQPLRDRIDGAL